MCVWWARRNLPLFLTFPFSFRDAYLREAFSDGKTFSFDLAGPRLSFGKRRSFIRVMRCGKGAAVLICKYFPTPCTIKGTVNGGDVERKKEKNR